MQEGVVSLCLCDTNGAEDVHINDTLVDEGYAKLAPYSSDSNDEENVETKQVC